MTEIETIDNFLEPSDLERVYGIAINSNFCIGWDDSQEVHKRAFPCLYSNYSREDIASLNINSYLQNKIKNKYVKEDKIKKCIVNLTKPNDVNFIHTHPDEVSVLLYINPTWHTDWGGETIFYKKDFKDILYTSIYTPNKCIIFDGNIPHTIKAQNILAPSYRFTLTLFFNKK